MIYEKKFTDLEGNGENIDNFRYYTFFTDIAVVN